MKKLSLILAVLLIYLPYQLFAAGISSWTTQTNEITGSDLIGITDVSDTTQSASGSSKKATMTQLGSFMATLFEPIKGADDNYVTDAQLVTIGNLSTASSRSAEDILSDSSNLPSGSAIIDWVGEGILTNYIETTAPDGERHINVLNTVAFSGTPSLGDCQRSTFLTPVGDYCWDGSQWVYQGVQGFTDLEADYSVLAPVETFLKTGTRAALETAIGGPLGMTTFMDLTDRPVSITLNELGMLAGVTSNLQQQIQNLHDRIDTLTSTPSAPVLNSATIGTTGTSLTLASNSNLTVGAGSSVFDVDCTLSGTNITATLLNGLGTPNLTYTLGSTVVRYDTCNLDHVQSGNGVEKASDGTDLASFTDMAINNQSLYETGGTAGLIFDMDFESTQTVDLSGWTIEQPAGSLTADYTSAISGTQSLYMWNNSGSYNSIVSPSIGPYNNLHYAFKIVNGIPTMTGTRTFGLAFLSGGASVGKTENNGNSYRPTHGSVIGGTVTSLVELTNYYVCGKIEINTNGTGVHKLNAGTSATPSENTTVSITTGTSTGAIDQIAVSQYGYNKMIFDDFILSTEPIAACSGAGL